MNSRESIERYQREVRRRFVELLGEWPERTPLEPQVVGRLERDGYSIEKLVLQSQPGFYVPINLYLPASDAPANPQPSPAKTVVKRPAVLCPLGHAPTGKAHAPNVIPGANSNVGADDYQALFVALVRRGYVVCAYDPLGQGEREPYGEKTGNHHHVQGYHCLP
ncbi:MAG TPA: alpha/beta hydrolase family protein, partial [Pirellulaceae bacterium]|nr:alpha/beta hydrolase family protein [Pirellulaceae bacterium]